MEKFDLYKRYLNVLPDAISPFIDELIDGISGKIEGEDANHLRQIINEFIKIDGYRKGKIHTAPKNILRNKISSALEKNPKLIDASLKVLSGSRDAIIDSIKPLVRKKVLLIKPADHDEKNSSELTGLDKNAIHIDLDSLVEEIQKIDAIVAKPEEIRLAI
jgi:hypothetical protein